MEQVFSGGCGVCWIGPPAGWFGPVRAALSTRLGGVSRPPFDSLNLGRHSGDAPEPVRGNEERLRRALGLLNPPARARLEHGTTILVVDREGGHGPADGLFTSRPDLPLWLTVADCIPVYFTMGEWVGILHAGWRGAADGVAASAARACQEASGLPGYDLRVWIGPGIQPCCYRVGRDVADRFPADAIRRAGGETFLDLPAAVRLDLASGGLDDRQVVASRLCTACRADLFFSYRRDRGRTGRMAALIWRPSGSRGPLNSSTATDDQPRIFR